MFENHVPIKNMKSRIKKRTKNVAKAGQGIRTMYKGDTLLNFR